MGVPQHWVNLGDIPCMRLKAHTQKLLAHGVALSDISMLSDSVHGCVTLADIIIINIQHTTWLPHHKLVFHSHSAHFHFTMSTQQSDTQLTSSSNVPEDFGTPMMPGEVIADATSLITMRVATIKKTKDTRLWLGVHWLQINPPASCSHAAVC